MYVAGWSLRPGGLWGNVNGDDSDLVRGPSTGTVGDGGAW